MSLIIEDGSIVPNANSFVTLVDARTRAAIYGLSLPVDDTEAENTLIAGAMWIKQQESELQGARIDEAQTLSYPRTPVYLYSFLLASDSIPQELIDSQVIAAVEQGVNGGILSFTSQTNNIKREKLDGVGEQEYYSGGKKILLSSTMLLAYSTLEPLTKSALSSGGGGLCLQRGC